MFNNVFLIIITIFKEKRLPIQMSLIQQFAIRNELLYSGFVLPNVQIFFVQKISFATFGVSIDDFFTRCAGLGYSLLACVITLVDITGFWSTTRKY